MHCGIVYSAPITVFIIFTLLGIVGLTQSTLDIAKHTTLRHFGRCEMFFFFRCSFSLPHFPPPHMFNPNFFPDCTFVFLPFHLHFLSVQAAAHATSQSEWGSHAGHFLHLSSPSLPLPLLCLRQVWVFISLLLPLSLYFLLALAYSVYKM